MYNQEKTIAIDAEETKDEYIPKISVIIPVYNVEAYLRECLESVINQPFRDIEIICVNDASKDNSLEILNEYQKKDSRIIVLNNKRNIRLGFTRNRGLEAARGKYVQFLDSDDWVEPEIYTKSYDLAERYGLDCLKFACENRIETDNRDVMECVYDADIVGKVVSPEDNPELVGFLEMAPLSIFRREFLNENNMRFADIINEDTPFYLETLTKAKRVMYLNDRFYNYRIREGSIMSKYCNKFERTFVLFEKIKSVADRAQNPVLQKQIYKLYFEMILARYIEFMHKRPVLMLRHLYRMCRFLAKYKSNSYYRYENDNIEYEIFKSHMKLVFPVSSALYIKLKKKICALKTKLC